MMRMERPRELKAHHLRREAWIYTRQSSQRQVRENVGSAEYQRSQSDLARKTRLGCPQDRMLRGRG